MQLLLETIFSKLKEIDLVFYANLPYDKTGKYFNGRNVYVPDLSKRKVKKDEVRNTSSSNDCTGASKSNASTSQAESQGIFLIFSFWQMQLISS